MENRSEEWTNLLEAIMEPQPFSVRDPVCGMEISPKKAAATSTIRVIHSTSVESSAKSSSSKTLNAMQKLPRQDLRN